MSAISEYDDTPSVSDTDESFFERYDEWSRGDGASDYRASYPFDVEDYIYDPQALGDEVSNEKQLKPTPTTKRHASITGATGLNVQFTTYFAEKQKIELKVRDLASRMEERDHERMASPRKVPGKLSLFPTVYPKSP